MSNTNIEIERSWLVQDGVNINELVAGITPQRILTGLVNPLGKSPFERYRSENDTFTYTTKTTDPENELKRIETNTVITESEFQKAIKSVAEIYDEHRYNIAIENNLTAELKIYSGELAGCNIIEVEFDSIEQSNKFVTPEWFGKEITGMNVIELFNQFRL